MTNPDFGGKRLEGMPGAAHALHNERIRRRKDGENGDGVQSCGNALAGIALLGEVLQTELEQYKQLGIDPTEGIPPFMPSYWLAHSPIDNKAAALSFAVGATVYGARLLSRRDRFPIDRDRLIEKLGSAVSYDPTTAKKYATRRKIGDIALGTAASAGAYFIGEQLDLVQSVMATGVAVVTGWTMVIGSKIRTALHKRRQGAPTKKPDERPGLEDGKTIH